jgi:hypothetical protein
MVCRKTLSGIYEIGPIQSNNYRFIFVRPHFLRCMRYSLQSLALITGGPTNMTVINDNTRLRFFTNNRESSKLYYVRIELNLIIAKLES